MLPNEAPPWLVDLFNKIPLEWGLIGLVWYYLMRNKPARETAPDRLTKVEEKVEAHGRQLAVISAILEERKDH